MRRKRWLLALSVTSLLLGAAAVRASYFDEAQAEEARPLKAAEADLAGQWWVADRELMIQMYQTNDGAWQGKIEASPRAAEVGHRVIRDARFDAGVYRGTLSMPDTGSASVELSMKTATSLKVVAKKLLLSKTFLWTRP